MPTSTQFHSRLIIAHELFTIILHSFNIATILSNTLMPELSTLSHIILSYPLLLCKLCSILHLPIIRSLSIIGS